MEDYKRKYEEALENLKKIRNSNENNKELVDFIEYKYPELKELDDERIQKEILEYFQQFENGELHGVNISDWIAWLEKQGEQKQVPITDEWIEDYWKHHKVTNPNSYDKGDEIQFDHDGFLRFCQANCKKSAWSEEDEWKFSDILALLRGGESCHYNTPELFDWLKSLKERLKGE